MTPPGTGGARAARATVPIRREAAVEPARRDAGGVCGPAGQPDFSENTCRSPDAAPRRRDAFRPGAGEAPVRAGMVPASASRASFPVLTSVIRSLARWAAERRKRRMLEETRRGLDELDDARLADLGIMRRPQRVTWLHVGRGLPPRPVVQSAYGPLVTAADLAGPTSSAQEPQP